MIRANALRDWVAANLLAIAYVETGEQKTDGLTKLLGVVELQARSLAQLGLA